jgi:hypothetical protein
MRRPPFGSNTPSVTYTRPVRPDDDAARLGELTVEKVSALIAPDSQQHCRREVSGLEAGLEGEDSVGREFVHVQRAVVSVDRDVLDRGEPVGGNRALRIGSIDRAERTFRGVRYASPERILTPRKIDAHAWP